MQRLDFSTCDAFAVAWSTTHTNTMTTQHTPGPWHTESNQFTVWDDKHAVASVYGTNAPEPMCSEARANARLIAAAPDQHAALLAIVKLLDGSQPKDIPGAIMVAQAAIAKAT